MHAHTGPKRPNNRFLRRQLLILLVCEVFPPPIMKTTKSSETPFPWVQISLISSDVSPTGDSFFSRVEGLRPSNLHRNQLNSDWKGRRNGIYGRKQ